MKNPLRRKALLASPSVVEAVQDRRSNFYVPLGGFNANYQQKAINAAFMRAQSASYSWLYMTRPPVRMVIDYLARNVAQVGLKTFERVDDDERVRDEGHPAAQTMKLPDGRTPQSQWIERYVADYCVFNNAYALKLRPSAGDRLTLIRVPPPWVAVYGGKLIPEMYRIFRTDGSSFDVIPDDIIHWHGYNPDDPLVGISPLETLRDDLSEDVASQQAVVELLKNGLKGGHIERPLEAPEWTPEAQMRFQEQWANQRNRSPKLDPILEEGMKWVPTAITPKDAELLASRRFTIEEVSNLYGVPIETFGLGQGVANKEEARKEVYADVIPPITNSLAAQLGVDLLLTEYDEPTYYFEFDLNEKMRGEPEKRFPAITASTGRPWRTVNEARTLENLPPIDGGDELTIPLNVALGELPAPNVMPPQDPNGPPQDGSHRSGEADAEEAPPKQELPPESLPPLLPKADATIAEEVRGLLERFFERERKSCANRGGLAVERFSRELVNDLTLIAPTVDVSAANEMSIGLHQGLDQALQREADPDRVFDLAKRTAGRLAELWVIQLGLDAKRLRELNVPDEIVWARAGFTPEQVDQMRAMEIARDLSRATASGESSDH